MENDVRVRRPIKVYLINALWILFAGYKAYSTEPLFGKYSWMFLALLSTVLLASHLRKPYYIEVHNGNLTINRDFFRSKVIDLRQIQKIEIDPSPFKSSYILMKDNKRVEFSDWNFDDKVLKEMMERFHIEVS